MNTAIDGAAGHKRYIRVSVLVILPSKGGAVVVSGGGRPTWEEAIRYWEVCCGYVEVAEHKAEGRR